MSAEVKPSPVVGDVPPEPRVLFYLLSFLVPLAGVILGALYLSKPDKENKEFGRYCLTAALVNMGLGLMVACCVLAAYVSFVVAYLMIIGGLIGAAGSRHALVWPWLQPK